MDFGQALQGLKEGKRMAREGWNGDGLFIFLTRGRVVPNNKERSFKYFSKVNIVIEDHIDMCTVKGNYVSGWTPSQADMLRKDWYEVTDEKETV